MFINRIANTDTYDRFVFFLRANVEDEVAIAYMLIMRK